MKMNAQRRLTLMMLTLAMFVFAVGVAFASPTTPAKKAHHHNSGHSLIAQKLKTPGTHQLEKKGSPAGLMEARGAVRRASAA